MTAADILKSLTDPANGNAVGARGTITALREDGNVNVRIGGPNGIMLPGIPCSTSYVSRAIGDTVQLVQFNNTWVVMSALGPDVDAKTPSVLAQLKYQYNLMNNQIADTQPTTLWIGQDTSRVTTAPMSMAVGYWNGTKNLLNTSTVGHSLSPIYLRVARTSDTVGNSGPITIEVVPHNSDTLPVPLITPLAAGFSTLLVNLEVGEVKDIPLPADWVAGITAAVPTIRGFMFIPGQFREASSAQDQTYVILSPSTGGITLGQWTAWQPVWSCSTTPPAIGNGLITGRYVIDANKRVTGVAQIAAGSTTTFGSGNMQLTYPAPPRIGSPDMVCQLRASGLPSGGSTISLMGQGVVADNIHMNLQCQVSATNGALQTMNTVGPIPTNGFGPSTIIRVNFQYEAA